MINQLSLNHFRCFKEKIFTFSDGINLFTGSNGSGKTSIIESLYLLGRGRSFRSNYLSDLIYNTAKDAYIILNGSHNDIPMRIGCHIQKSSLIIKINNNHIVKRSDLLDYLPLQIITPTSHELIDSGPTYRRKFIDWGLFHVEQSYRNHWLLFRRVLKQRNHLLKNHSSEINHWNEEFVRYATLLSESRANYFKQLNPFFEEIQLKLLGSIKASINFYPGWNAEFQLIDLLIKNLSRDRTLGWTSVGPHKSDIRFDFPQSARNVLSRGQQKMLVFALQIAQCLHLSKIKDVSPILLIDDISSELDAMHLNLLFDQILDTGLQSFVSSIDTDKVDKKIIGSLFHVEH